MKRFEQAMLLVERDADARVAHAEVGQPLLGMREVTGVWIVPSFKGALPVGGGFDLHQHFARAGELHRVADEIDQNLAQAGHVANKNLGMNPPRYTRDRVFPGRFGRQEINASSMQVWISKG